jgi:O-antigen/teichoic acid export membrane protein
VIGTGTAQLLVAALYLLTARSLRPDQYGLVVTAIGLGVAGAGFADLGANSYWIRELASGRITQRDLAARVSTRFVVVLVVATALILGALVLSPVFIATGVTMVTTSAVQTMLVPLRAARRAEAVAWLTIAGRVVALAIFLGATAVGVSPALALWTSLALGDLGLSVCAFALTRAPDRLKLWTCRMGNPWSGVRWYAVSALGLSAQQLDLPILAALSGPTAAGIYGGVNRWIQPLGFAIGAFTSAAAPFMAAEQRLVALRGQLLRASWMLIMAIALCVVVFATAPWLVTSLLGTQFSDSGPVLRLLALAMLLNTVNQPLLVALQSRRYDHVAAGLIAAAVATHLITVAVLAPTLGALGAAAGFLVGQTVAVVGTVSWLVVMIRRRRAGSKRAAVSSP